MKLYLLSRKKIEWETYSSFVVRAESEIGAFTVAGVSPRDYDIKEISAEGNDEIIAEDYHGG